MAEPDWKLELQRAVDRWVDRGDRQFLAYQDLLPHIEAAYQRGLMAGRSQAGYTTRRKRKEDRCPPTDAPCAGPPSRASSTGGDP